MFIWYVQETPLCIFPSFKKGSVVMSCCSMLHKSKERAHAVNQRMLKASSQLKQDVLLNQTEPFSGLLRGDDLVIVIVVVVDAACI